MQPNKTQMNLDHKIKIAALVRCWHVIGFDCCLNFLLTLSVKLCRYFNDILSSDFWDLRARSGNLAKILKSLKSKGRLVEYIFILNYKFQFQKWINGLFKHDSEL